MTVIKSLSRIDCVSPQQLHRMEKLWDSSLERKEEASQLHVNLASLETRSSSARKLVKEEIISLKQLKAEIGEADIGYEKRSSVVYEGINELKLLDSRR